MPMLADSVMRIARPTDAIEALLPFYCEGLGFSRIAEFSGHAGFDGVILGHPAIAYHLEFTHQAGHRVGRAPTHDHLLVFYLPQRTRWATAVLRMRQAGFDSVTSYNPYWDRQGCTFEDPDGYRVVLQCELWQPTDAVHPRDS